KNKWEKEFSAGKWDYLDSTPSERARSAIIGMYCQHFFPKGKILDVGCGLGTTTDFLIGSQKKQYLGLDISEEALKKALIKKVKFKNTDFANFKSVTKFEIIIFNEVLYYMNEADALKQALNILAKNGIVIISLYRMKNKRYDQKIWKASRKLFRSVEAIEITSTVKKQLVTWRVEVLKRK
ncbi:MAG: hypothetical protein A2546_07255, partial [Sphingobacteriia bacterium RIFOXYD2_FULL_35_12]